MCLLPPSFRLLEEWVTLHHNKIATSFFPSVQCGGGGAHQSSHILQQSYPHAFSWPSSSHGTLSTLVSTRRNGIIQLQLKLNTHQSLHLGFVWLLCSKAATPTSNTVTCLQALIKWITTIVVQDMLSVMFPLLLLLFSFSARYCLGDDGRTEGKMDTNYMNQQACILTLW